MCRTFVVALTFLACSFSAFAEKSEKTSFEQESLICYQDQSLAVKVFDLSFDPLKKKRVAQLRNTKIEDVYQAQNSLYGEDFFLEPVKGNHYHLTIGDKELDAFCVGQYDKSDLLEEQQKFAISFSGISFR